MCPDGSRHHQHVASIAAGIHWLLSDQSSFVAGAILNIDGGFQAK